MQPIDPNDLTVAVEAIPAGAWAVGVSGGVDSVALLELARSRGDLRLHVTHLDHETRAGASTEDAQFVAKLAAKWNLPVTISKRSEIESSISETNTAARYRAARFALFRQVVDAHRLQGVILAHHADDQAETVLQRLLRGSGPAGLGGMPPVATIGGLCIHRPLLGVTKEALRALLIERGTAWREDVSNAAPSQQRNRLRALLVERPELAANLMALADACRTMMTSLRQISPTLAESFDVSTLSELVKPLARESARRWLGERAGIAVEIPPAAIDRLLQMAGDAATPPRQHFPGKLMVRRKAGRISASSEATPVASQPPRDAPRSC